MVVNLACLGYTEKMKIFLTLSLILASIFAQSAEAASKNYTLDLAKSGLRWKGSFMKAPIQAQMKFRSGQFALKGNTALTGSLVADMKSLNSDSGMDAQIKSPLFLNVEKFPTSELKIKTFQELHPFARGGANARITGILTFRGETHPVKGDFVMTKDKNGFHVVGTFPTVYQKMVEGSVTYEIWTKP
jgi:polyisoprenoid-binding protein YceI